MPSLVLLCLPLLTGLPLDTKAEVEAIIARATLPYSGLSTYSTVVEWPTRKKTDREDGKKFLLSGENWVLGSQQRASSQRSVFGLFVHAFSSDRQTIDGIQIEPGRRFTDTPPPPTVAGTLWYTSTRRFLQDNIDKVSKKGREKVGEYSCNVYEWHVPVDHLHGFGAYGSRLEQHGGIIRILSAPSLGYALPRVDYLSISTGKEVLEHRYEAMEFFEGAEGVYLPRTARKQYFEGDSVSFSCTLDNITWEYVNEEIPESAFKLHVPFRTIIVDLRGKKRQYRFESVAALPEDLRVLFSDTPIPPLPPPTPKPVIGTAGWLGIGAGAVIALYLLLIFLRRSPAA